MKDFEGFIKNYATRDFIYFFAEKSIEIYKNQVEKLDEHLVCNITFPLNIIQHVDITDRKEAIKYAIEHGEPGDIIVLAGKGHEDYQEIKGVKYPMDERVLIKEVLEELKGN